MSDYEALLLGGAVIFLIAVLSFFKAVTQDRPIGVATMFFIGGAVLLYFASEQSMDGIHPRDIPVALYKLIAQFA